MAIALNRERNIVIQKIKGKEDISLQVDDYQQQPNPEKFKGNLRLGVNIDVHQKEKFYQNIKNEPSLSLINSSYHQNSVKTDYFTFIFEDVNEELKNYF